MGGVWQSTGGIVGGKDFIFFRYSLLPHCQLGVAGDEGVILSCLTWGSQKSSPEGGEGQMVCLLNGFVPMGFQEGFSL